MMITRLSILAITVIFFAGCSQLDRTLSCDEIFATPVTENMGELLSLDAIILYIENNFGLTSENIIVEDYEENTVKVVIWIKKGVKYTIRLKDGMLNETRIYYQSARPTGKQVIACLHTQPSWYVAIYGDNSPILGGKRFLFELYFPDRGVYTQLQESGQDIKHPPTLDADVPLSLLVLVEPGSLEEVFFRAKHNLLLKEASAIQQPQPWPGNWEEVPWLENNEPDW